MKLLGIDYGTKNVGIALSDEGMRMAFPNTVLKNNDSLLDEIEKIVDKHEVKEIVIGDPGDNEFAKSVNVFIIKLTERLFLPIHKEAEFMTSLHVDMFTKTKPIARKTKQKVEAKKDDSAAALILQRYLDKK